MSERMWKASYDEHQSSCSSKELMSVERLEGAIIVGAGPAGLATAMCLQKSGIRHNVVLEQADCVASLWRHRTYDRLRLHLPKHICQLPHVPFPAATPKFPTRSQFVAYMDEYARVAGVQPRFNQRVSRACFDKRDGLWLVLSELVLRGDDHDHTGAAAHDHDHDDHDHLRRKQKKNILYVAPWLVVASGENAQPFIPADLQAKVRRFGGKVIHSSQYKNGLEFTGKRVLVVGCGNSGMEISLDLANFNAAPAICIRDSVHILPREILGLSTFCLAMTLKNYLSLKWTDRVLMLLSRMVLGDPSKYGIKRPVVGPLELKFRRGKTPLLDVGTLARIRQGGIQVVPGIQWFTSSGCVFKDETYAKFDAVILATGYKSNVPTWLRVEDQSMIPEACNGRWKASERLYFAGFSRMGLQGISNDALRIAADIREESQSGSKRRAWKEEPI